MAVCTENQIDAGHGAREREIVVEMFMADHYDDVRALLAQFPHCIARRGNRIAKMKDRLSDERLEVAARDGKHSDTDSVDDE